MESLLPVAEKIAKKLIERKETIAVAEGSGGGLISAALLSVPVLHGFESGATIAIWRSRSTS